MHSPDGIVWRHSGVFSRANLRAIAWNGTRFVAVGTGSQNPRGRNSRIASISPYWIVHSSDGISWSVASIPGFPDEITLSNVESSKLYAIAWNGARFVAVGLGGTIVHSPKGMLWSVASPPIEPPAKDCDPSGRVDGGFSNKVGTAAAESAPAVIRVHLRHPDKGIDTYVLGDTIYAVVVFDKSVKVTGCPQVALTVGTQIRQATYDSSVAYGLLVFFKYVVQVTDRDADGISIAANALALNGGTIKAAADGTTDAVLTHDAVAADPDYKVDGQVR